MLVLSREAPAALTESRVPEGVLVHSRKRPRREGIGAGFDVGREGRMVGSGHAARHFKTS